MHRGKKVSCSLVVAGRKAAILLEFCKTKKFKVILSPQILLILAVVALVGLGIARCYDMPMRLSHKEAHQVGEILSEAAETEIMPRFQTLVADQVREKSSAFDIVTEADEAAEQVIANRLKAVFPTCIVIGEEATAKDKTLLKKIATAELAFIIDPIDGTKNYVSGLPLFGVMAAATMHGEVVLGAIHDPVRQDTAFALAGEGAWLQKKGPCASSGFAGG